MFQCFKVSKFRRFQSFGSISTKRKPRSILSGFSREGSRMQYHGLNTARPRAFTV